MTNPIPHSFCWTRFGTEAGEAIDEILARKETERRANHGVFFWGIGTALGPAIRELLRYVVGPEVLFSPMRSRPRQVDVAPKCVVRWRSGEGLNGAPYELPDEAIVTS